MNGIPVMIHLDVETLTKLERIGANKGGVKPARLIELLVARALQPKRDHTRRRSRGEVKPGGKRAYVTLDADQQAELVELTRLGWSLSELADRYGCSTSTVDNWRRRLGVQRRRKEDM